MRELGRCCDRGNFPRTHLSGTEWDNSAMPFGDGRVSDKSVINGYKTRHF